ncbi:UDP-N-acetylmuramoyl-L-alanyl-D-glutamate--2,6-diaminopimelate ligase [Koleobacter methoxysyntrophicus]|uniref:UDP-N-acetylmuramoyl-L-alanyl-D-glutamate--2,6-diaminopimelate ligase n=1 Tax=Koleobacter methoxysyntrophicus TaxID=2751313 RepID=A0A8A0RP97_9FIRM|nr:UDP-N-acetylmuramoyl-L-alanyl-D-glutamate--2,6-diaminopimelate ligase [Koleobacter methoxysyntrophicus]QSQ09732.1 UDP-N-acetylmuramoyl-L-alanyl-D-glutamate--2,6-diaminopimelate ligase [Koleobacter methoxysyntrophicus]
MSQLKKLIEKLDDIKELKGESDKEIQGIAYDSRKVEKDFIFVAIKGFVHDGHDFIGDAVKKGAACVVVEEGVPLPLHITQIKVKNTRKALACLTKAFYNNLDEKMHLIGVTGTNGKTTTTHLIKKILEESGKKVGLIGTISNKIGDREIQAERTTPEAPDLFKLFKEMYDNGVEYVVMEVSSHSLELERVYGLKFKIGVFTNLTQDHLDFHENFENYYQAKKKLFKISSLGVINCDDKAGRRLVDEIDIPVLTYGIGGKCDIKAENINFSSKGVTFDIATPSVESYRISLNIPGTFSVYNALACISTGIALDIDLQKIKKALAQIRGVPGRFEIIDEGQDFTVIVDYAHTPDGLENILKGVKEFASGKIIVVFGCGGNRDKKKRPVMGRIATEIADLSVITSDNPRYEEPEAIISEIEEGAKLGRGEYIKIADRRAGIEYALKHARKDDVVVIAGKGHETYQIIGDKSIPFDDREVAREILRGFKK